MTIVNNQNLISDIDGIALEQARSEKNLSRSELAARLCLALKHIQQLEEGGDSSFFQVPIKFK